ncbi:hypothetical protein ABH939_006234 [Rhodococcus sp. 27YEA6]
MGDSILGGNDEVIGSAGLYIDVTETLDRMGQGVGRRVGR